MKKTCMWWSCWNQPLHKENPSSLDFSYCSIRNWECWNFIITSSTSSVIWLNLKSWRWTQTHFTWHLLKKIYTTLSNQLGELLGKKLGKMIVETLSRRMQNLIFSLERVAVRIKSMIRGSRDFLKKNLDVQKCSVCVARHIAAMTTCR